MSAAGNYFQFDSLYGSENALVFPCAATVYSFGVSQMRRTTFAVMAGLSLVMLSTFAVPGQAAEKNPQPDSTAPPAKSGEQASQQEAVSGQPKSGKHRPSKNQAQAANEIPIQGMEVVLQKLPTKAVVGRSTTNENGEFDFGPQEKGSYRLIINPPPDQVQSVKGTDPDKPFDENTGIPKTRKATVVFEGVEDGPITAHLRFASKQIAMELKKPVPVLGIMLPIEAVGDAEIKGLVREPAPAPK